MLQRNLITLRNLYQHYAKLSSTPDGTNVFCLKRFQVIIIIYTYIYLSLCFFLFFNISFSLLLSWSHLCVSSFFACLWMLACSAVACCPPLQTACLVCPPAQTTSFLIMTSSTTSLLHTHSLSHALDRQCSHVLAARPASAPRLHHLLRVCQRHCPRGRRVLQADIRRQRGVSRLLCGRTLEHGPAKLLSRTDRAALATCVICIALHACKRYRGKLTLCALACFPDQQLLVVKIAQGFSSLFPAWTVHVHPSLPANTDTAHSTATLNNRIMNNNRRRRLRKGACLCSAGCSCSSASGLWAGLA